LAGSSQKKTTLNSFFLAVIEGRGAMLDTISDLVTGIIEVTARGVYALVRMLFGWEASRERPAWVRVVAIGLILLLAAILFSLLFTVFITALYVLLAIAAVGAVLAFFAAS
jgi:hypothetical protein